MKLSNTIFDLSEYIEPYPQLEKIGAESLRREFRIADEMFNSVRSHDGQNGEIRQTFNYIRDADTSAKNWIFRTFD